MSFVRFLSFGFTYHPCQMPRSSNPTDLMTADTLIYRIRKSCDLQYYVYNTFRNTHTRSRAQTRGRAHTDTDTQTHTHTNKVEIF